MTDRVYHAYVCPICEVTWPHPSFKCSGIGGFADHPQTPTELRKLVPAVPDERQTDDDRD